MTKTKDGPKKIEMTELEALELKLKVEETKLKIMQTKAAQSALKSDMNETGKSPEPLAQEEF